MKKLTIEQKAEAYDNLIERLKDFRFEYRFSAFSDTIERYFPELKGSDGEKIRKEIIEYFKHYSGGDNVSIKFPEWIIWLEKQGEQNATELSNICEYSLETWIKIVDFVLTEHNGIGNYLDSYETKDTAEKLREKYKFDAASEEWDRVYRKGLDAGVNKGKAIALKEQKPTDNVEPKFKVGDWVTDGVSKCQIRFIDDTQYWYSENCCILGNIESIDKRYRLWTIQDAKDGDVLAVEPIDGYPSPFIAIYKERGLDFFNSHCFVSRDGEFHEGTTGHDINLVHPATKEQCDTLMKAMADAGYTFDFEKKELKKNEQELDEKYNEWYGFIRWFVKQRTDDHNLIPSSDDIHKWSDNILNHARKVFGQNTVEWSEEDERMIDTIISDLERHGGKEDSCYSSEINYLKSLKDRVQPQLKKLHKLNLL